MIRILFCSVVLAVAAPAWAFVPDAPDQPAEPGDTVFHPSFPSPGAAAPDQGPDEVIPPDKFPGEPDQPKGPPPPVHYGEADMPAPVRETRAAIMAAAKTGDIEALRPLLVKGNPATLVSPTEGGDPVEVLKSEAGDPAGREILAIMLDVLDAGWVVVDQGTPDERYVWPYFAEYPPDALTPPQLVEVYRVLTAGDFESMQAAEAYVFYSVEIAPDGRWVSFMSGE